jgi:DNA-binding beta-propeller fold protein YncE
MPLRPITAAAVLAVGLGAALGADQPQGADVLSFRENRSNTQAKAVWLTKTPPPVLPVSDPRLVGATLRILGLDQESLFVLPPERWTLDATGTRYRFKDLRNAPGRPAPVRDVVIQQGKRLKVTGISERIDLDGAVPDDVSIQLSVGADVYCATCTTPLSAAAGVYRARNCTAPATCPVLPSPPCGTFVTKWGRLGAGAGEFDYIYGVATDGDRDVYVVDRLNRRVQRFDGSGVFVGEWGTEGTGDGQFELPVDLWVEGPGTVLVADVATNRIQRFTAEGVYLGQWGSTGTADGQFNSPYGMATDASGAVYVADTFNHRIQKFDAAGNFLLAWGGYGHDPGQFDYPYDVAVDATGNVYVADYENYRVQKFDGSGGFLTMWGSEGSGNGQFEGAYSIATDASGRVLVADSAADRIQVFDGAGGFITAWGTTGPADAQFLLPDGIAAADGGRVYVADRGNERIQLFLCP